MSSCKDENDAFDEKGKLSIISFEGPSSAYMGDSISFTFQVKGESIKLNQSKVQFYYGEEMVSEAFYTTGKDGTYTGKVAIPFLKDIPDGEAKVTLRVQNERFATDSETLSITITRPQFPKLILKSQDGSEYEMLPVDGRPYEYSAKGKFPYVMNAKIIIPAYGENGNEIIFGMTNSKIIKDAASPINFEGEPNEEGEYQITFNTQSFEGTPFIKFGIYFSDESIVEFSGSGTTFTAETEFKQNEDIRISGLKTEYPDYWINPTYFDKVKGTNGKTLRFRGMNGKYRLTVDKDKKYFYVEKMNGNSLASISDAKNANVMWTIGDGNIGYPSYKTNNINWSENKAVCLIPLEQTKHQLILEAGRNISTNNINYKFFGQKGWGFEFTAPRIKIADGSSWFRINASDGNIRGGSTPLISGKYYIVTIETSEVPAQVSVKEVDDIPEVE